MDFDLMYESSYPTPAANSTLLPLLLMSLLQQRYAPRVSSSVRKEYDYIVVGAGSAGSVVASRLSEKPCVNVLLLEAGKKPPLLTEIPAYYQMFSETDIDWGYQTVTQKHIRKGFIYRKFNLPRGKTIGGSSIIHGMIYGRGNSKNYDDWALQGADGWSWKDVLPYFMKLEDYKDLRYLRNGYHSIWGPVTVENPTFQEAILTPLLEAAKLLGYEIVDSAGEKHAGFFPLDFSIRNGQRCSSAKAYLVPAENRTNLDIFSEAFVKKIVLENNRATGVIFDYKGATYQVKAKREVIISGGVINTPQILMLSGIGPKGLLEKLNIPVVADLPVGENLHNHYGSILPYVMDVKTPFSKKISDPNNILLYINDRSGPLSASFPIPVVASLHGSQPSATNDFPSYHLSINEMDMESFRKATGMTNEIYELMYSPYKNSTLFTCFSTILQPRSRGSITLQSSNPYDPPLIDPNYQSDLRDIDDIVQGLKICEKLASSSPMKNARMRPLDTLFPGCEQYSYNQDLYLRCYARFFSSQLNHPVGTAKMGRISDPTTVVDSKLRVKGIQGLRVVDASVMPTIPSAVTYIPTVMVAEKASDIIKETIQCI